MDWVEVCRGEDVRQPHLGSLGAPKPVHSNPQVVGILALSDSNVYAIGNGTYQVVGGPVVVLHFNGHNWSKLAACPSLPWLDQVDTLMP